MNNFLWRPSKDRVKNANMTKFIGYVNEKYDLDICNYHELYKWSVDNIPDFWAAVWDFCGVIASQRYKKVIDDLGKFPGAKWFIGAKLNFAENLLRYRDDHLAFIFRNEAGERVEITYSELYDYVSRLAKPLHELGLLPGDRVAAYMPTMPETAIAMLASTSRGAVWASCGTELGPITVLDRFSQIKPKVLFTVDGYWYKGKEFKILSRVKKIVEKIPSLEKVIVFPYISEKPNISDISNAVDYHDFMDVEKNEIKFEQVSSNHPVYIMFSSGTTGKPKSMFQSVAGVLVNHLKELVLHTDLRREDRINYITSPSWMMWHWTMSSLAVGATLVLYDGNPLYPDWRRMWRIIHDEKITIFGCSASYIYALMNMGAEPSKEFNLSSLREISQTGSTLSPDGFEWVYKKVKRDLHFNSISGGTDINGCFAAGSPTLPVFAGELQARALGMKVKAYDEKGRQVVDQEGELVCEAPTPSMPIYFWNDPGNRRYLEAYFEFYKSVGKNVWRHGDYVMIHSDTGGITIYGRSDATLKPSGVRIGTAEIYNIVEKLPEVEDSLAVGQYWRGDQRIILFVKLKSGYKLTDELKNRIRKTLREYASPRHVPVKILETPDIPYTFNMKKVEIAVANMINGRPVTNKDALVNPESLDYFEKILPELQKD